MDSINDVYLGNHDWRHCPLEVYCACHHNRIYSGHMYMDQGIKNKKSNCEAIDNLSADLREIQHKMSAG